jgi:hypothetical protein
LNWANNITNGIDALNAIPTSKAFTLGTTDLHPTGVVVNGTGNALTLVNNLGSATTTYAKFVNEDSADNQVPQLQFTGNSYSTGKISYAIDAMMCTFDSGQITGNTLTFWFTIADAKGVNQNLPTSFLVVNGSPSGFCTQCDSGKTYTPATWSFNTPVHLIFTFDFTNGGAYSISANGVSIASNFAFTDSNGNGITNVSGFYIDDAHWIGGSNSNWTAGIGNVTIASYL